MRPLSAGDLLDVFEEGHALHAIDRALLVVARSCPEQPYEALTRLSLGQRDALLLKIRRQTFGDRLDARATCPECRESLEFTCSCQALLVESTHEDEASLAIEAVRCTLRPIDSLDAAAAVRAESIEAATRALIDRCLRRDRATAIPLDAIQAAVSDALLSLDPQVEVQLRLQCPSCGHRWESIFDIASFFWAEIRAHAKRLLQEIDLLARIYGWAERDILGMTAIRRRMYLEMAAS